MPTVIVIHIHLVLLKDVLRINGQQWFQHGHHPCKTDICQLLVIITASDIGVNPWKPYLYQSLPEVSANAVLFGYITRNSVTVCRLRRRSHNAGAKSALRSSRARAWKA